MNQRILVLILLVAALAFGIFWMTSSDPRGELEEVGDNLPTLEMGTGTTTVPVPVDADIVTREREINGRTYEYPAVDVQTEDREIEYPTINVVPADEQTGANDSTIQPRMDDRNNATPAVDAGEAYEDAKDAVEKEINELDRNNNGTILE